MRFLTHIVLIAIGVMAASAAYAAGSCGGDFATWLGGLKGEAAAAGVSQSTLSAALDGVTPDPTVLSRDRSQQVFNQSFEQFSGRMVSADRLKKGALLLKQNASMLSRIEEQYGVPGPVLVAIWGLETDFGVNVGKFSTIRALATLAYDCRRPERFRPELIDALRIIDRGDMSAGEMHGAWAGEIGQTQFLPSSYLKFAVDYDGNGRRDLIRSAPDVLASTANYLKGYGWQKGVAWGEGSANFNVLLQWNQSPVYSKTIAYFADRLAATE
jgi:lytic murein transglycosylase